MNADEEEFPLGHPERRQVSNAMLAFQLATLQESQTAQNALLREQVRDGFALVRVTLDKHTDQIAQIREQIVDLAARMSEQERWRHEQELADRHSNEQTHRELAQAQSGASSDALNRRIAAIAVTALTLVIAVLGTYAALKG